PPCSRATTSASPTTPCRWRSGSSTSSPACGWTSRRPPATTSAVGECPAPGSDRTSVVGAALVGLRGLDGAARVVGVVLVRLPRQEDGDVRGQGLPAALDPH